MAVEDDSLMSLGNLFHSFGPAREKDLEPADRLDSYMYKALYHTPRGTSKRLVFFSCKVCGATFWSMRPISFSSMVLQGDLALYAADQTKNTGADPFSFWMVQCAVHTLDHPSTFELDFQDWNHGVIHFIIFFLPLHQRLFESHWTLSVNSTVQGPHFLYHNLYIK